MKLILASQSPRRCEILKNAGYDFEIKPADIDEVVDEKLLPSELVCSLATQKAEAVYNNLNNKDDVVVIGSDTIVSLGNKVLGKPKDKQQAFEMLKSLSGKQHEVYTGVCLKSKDKTISFYDCTKVEFYELNDEQIKAYIETGEPMDKAGSYGIQAKGCILVKGIVGDYFSVMGFPISKTARELEKFCINIPY